MTAPHTTPADLEWEQWDGYRVARIRLRRGETVENPVCTTCVLRGPLTVEYRQYRDGGIDAVIVEGEDGHAR